MAGKAQLRAQQQAELQSRMSAAGSQSARSGSQSVRSGISSSSGKASGNAPGSRAPSSKAPSVPGYDGNRDPGSPRSGTGSPRSAGSERNPANSRVIVDGKNMDLGMAMWSTIRGYQSNSMPTRPAPSSLGTATKIGLNSFRVTKVPTDRVYQYDVQIGNQMEKRGLIEAVWKSEALRKELGPGFIFDGNKLAWSMKPLTREIRIIVDLDKEKGKTPRADKKNEHRVLIRCTNTVRFDVLVAYLEGKTSFDNSVLEAINFFDHLLREFPRGRYVQIKRSFFAKAGKGFELGPMVEAVKGCYQSLRIAYAGRKEACLSINVDVANGTFWKKAALTQAAIGLSGRRDINDLIQGLRQGDKGRVGQDCKKLRKLRVIAQHRGKGQQDEYVIERLVWQGARDFKFEDPNGKSISIYDYFAKKYNVRLQYPDLPLVKMTKGKNTVLPMEVLTLKDMQRYQYKMDERQTSNMIKFAVTPPAERWQAVQHGLGMLDWKNDPVLKHFGVQIDDTKTMVDARVIAAPKVQFGQGEAKPGTSGRWDLKGKKFLQPNTAPLKSWGVCVVPGRRGGKPDKTTVQNFVTEFCKVYKGHGGRVENTQPFFQLASGEDVGAWVTAVWNGTGNAYNARPQLLVFILPDKDTTIYGRIKRSAECRYGVVSQCMQYAHVQKCQGQYISNVCMKVNAKLGGSTGRAIGAKSAGPTGLFTVPTLIIGADVSHAAPGAQNPSMAALTVSMDRLGIRYAAACETNGFRVEMITTENINSMLKPLIQSWVGNVGGGRFPSRIIYFRDGVSEGQYQHVIQQEVHDMKALLKTADPNLNIPFMVVVGSKRHHIRFFPEQGKGDRNGNPLPGTLVETGVTHPFENDFYLCSHAAIKGTARPMHYHVILNEVGMSNEELQTIIYEHCYQYIRATTPVSQHPAIYYAHIASNRAVPHDPKWGGSSEGPAPTVASRPRSGSQGKSGEGSSSGVPTSFERLMPMPNQGAIQTAMWYI